MKTSLLTFFTTILLSTATLIAEPPTKEMIATIDAVDFQVNSGNLDALDRLRAIPKDTSFHPLFRYILQNRWRTKDPQSQKITAKATKIIIETPNYTEYFTGLFTPDNLPYEKNPNFRKLRRMAIETLGHINNRDAIRILCDALKSTEGSFIAGELAKMNIPGAPYSSKQWEDALRNPESVKKWLAWWNANKEKYEPEPAK